MAIAQEFITLPLGELRATAHRMKDEGYRFIQTHAVYNEPDVDLYYSFMKDGKITNDKRIVAALPTIQKLITDGAKVILCSHLGKPKNGPEAKFSLAPVAGRLSELLGKNVVFADDDNVVGENAKAAVAAMQDGDVVLLQTTRFRKEETKNIEDFSKDLASLADAYVDDAFGSRCRLPDRQGTVYNGKSPGEC